MSEVGKTITGKTVIKTIGNKVFVIAIDPFDHVLKRFSKTYPDGSKKSSEEASKQAREYIFAYQTNLFNWAAKSMNNYGEFLKGMLEDYRYGDMPMTGGKVLANGCYEYPGDPIFEPMLRVSCENEIINFYDYAIFSIVKLDENGIQKLEDAIVYRMD